MTEAPVCVGIDMSNARLDVAVRPLGTAFGVDHDEAGLVTLSEHLRRHPPALVVLEAHRRLGGHGGERAGSR